ncbi:hypothetical protein SISSUDRAFT_1039974 [Sistotremastrum suecicum HHB10207 ss-3]|uniref:Amidohydrolase-related domain-containing protein n=1 Tax=Sistotremastrum suecicum HHB10207 ss-3 TaxID=1314776 RepID=A0A166I9Q0_9AGAM|nr:hypothetical protein SISSUDRAFT_1039974 [Sistotremastrum suecicum HHB10207 ss-3]
MSSKHAWKSPPSKAGEKFLGIRVLALLALAFWAVSYILWNNHNLPVVSLRQTTLSPYLVEELRQKCSAIRMEAGPPESFNKRSESDRYVPGTPAVLLRNATLWTGGGDDQEILYQTDLLLDRGIIVSVGNDSYNHPSIRKGRQRLQVLDLDGAWVTPGIVDMHSHIGDDPSPSLRGAEDENSVKGPILPWLRSLDGLNTHDDSFELSISGGVTTSLVLPGSANAIGGQGFVIKLRSTAEKTPSSKLLEPPFSLNGSVYQDGERTRWRHIKCISAGRVYGGSRMDTYWAFREAYDKATQVKKEQDEFCAMFESNQLHGLTSRFPESLQWESLVDVLRGRVKVHTHCYEAVDLDALIRISNEFKFPLAAFHHAHEAYLVPDLLKKAWGQPPALALFATNSRYKREAYRGSEFAAKILSENGLKVTMKSDHPVLDSRYLLYEAQQAHYYGLKDHLAIASVITTPAQVLGLDHRLGYLRTGYDADVVVWDSHPLALGATPRQVFIDGIAQLKNQALSSKPPSFQKPPRVPNFDKEAQETIEYDGLPPLKYRKIDSVLFTNVAHVFAFSGKTIVDRLLEYGSTLGQVLVTNGSITCAQTVCMTGVPIGIEVVDLEGGSINPGLLAYGPDIGLEEISAESSTNDGVVLDPLKDRIPSILGGEGSLIRAADGIQFGGRDLLLASRAGVTRAVTAPSHSGFWGGLSVYFSVSAVHRLEAGAIIQDAAAVHVAIRHGARKPSVSTQVTALRNLLLGHADGLAGEYFKRVALGKVTLVVEVHDLNIIGTLLTLKAEIEEQTQIKIKMTISGASEAHLLAEELSRAEVSVILNPSRPFPTIWEKRQILPGPPLTHQSAILKLLEHNVTVGIGVEELWSARNIRFDAGWAAIEAGGKISKEQAFSIASLNLEKALGMSPVADFVATRGGDLLEMNSKVVASILQRRSTVELHFATDES